MTRPGGAGPSCTRSTRAASPTPTATASATSRGITAHLDHLAALGVDVVWLSPIYPSPQDDNGYDISDYQDIDPSFGTLEDFDELLDGVHERGMRLVMDLVVNHTSDEHPWFVESRSSHGQPQARLVLVAPAPRGHARRRRPAPSRTTGRSFFCGPAWELDPATGEYYLHLFSRKQPDLNWENPEVRAGDPRDDALVARPRGRRLPHGRDQHDLQGPVAARRVASPAARGRRLPHFIDGPRIHEFLAEMYGGSSPAAPGSS